MKKVTKDATTTAAEAAAIAPIAESDSFFFSSPAKGSTDGAYAGDKKEAPGIAREGTRFGSA